MVANANAQQQGQVFAPPQGGLVTAPIIAGGIAEVQQSLNLAQANAFLYLQNLALQEGVQWDGDPLTFQAALQQYAGQVPQAPQQPAQPQQAPVNPQPQPQGPYTLALGVLATQGRDQVRHILENTLRGVPAIDLAHSPEDNIAALASTFGEHIPWGLKYESARVAAEVQGLAAIVGHNAFTPLPEADILRRSYRMLAQVQEEHFTSGQPSREAMVGLAYAATGTHHALDHIVQQCP